jgi:hypothetical protein
MTQGGSALSWRPNGWGTSLAAAVISAAFIPLPTLGAQTPALTLAEVLELRNQGVSSRQILRSAREYCIAFTVNDSIERQLGAAGADSALVTGLRTACSKATTTPARPTPTPSANSDIVLDDDFTRSTGRSGFTLNDRRCSSRLDSTGLRLEYKDREGVCVIGYHSAPLDDNVRIELSVSRLGAYRLGLVVLGFGRDPGVQGQQYSFSVTADRKVELCRADGGTCQRLIYKTGVSAVHGGASDDNVLAVEIRGRRMTLIVNDATIGSYTTNANISGGLSLGVGPGTSLTIKKLVARRLSPAPLGP